MERQTCHRFEYFAPINWSMHCCTSLVSLFFSGATHGKLGVNFRSRVELLTASSLARILQPNVWNSLSSSVYAWWCSLKKLESKWERKRQLGCKNHYLLFRESQNTLTDSYFTNAWVSLRRVNVKVEGFSCWEASPDVEGSRSCSVVSMWMERGGGKRQVGWSVKSSHWCALSYVRLNHDSEMTYFLTPQTNSTFNRSQGLCQTFFFLQSLKSCI